LDYSHGYSSQVLITGTYRGTHWETPEVCIGVLANLTTREATAVTIVVSNDVPSASTTN